MSLTSVDLPEPETPVTATNSPSGKRHVDVAQVVLAGPDDRELPARGPRAADVGQRDRLAAGEVLPGHASPRASSRSSTVPECDDLAAVLAGARADVDHPVGDPDGVLVVLDDDEGVAQVAEPDQRLDQPVVVALVQADRRLVEDVEHADQPGTDLGGEPDPLRLAAGQRAGGPVQREVVQADVEQEPEPLLDLLEHPLGDLALAGAQRRASRGTRRVSLIGQRADLGDVPAADRSPRATTGLSRVPSHAGHGTSRMKPSNRSRLVSDSASRCRRSM